MKRRPLVFCLVNGILFFAMSPSLYAAPARVHFKGTADIIQKRILGEIAFSDTMKPWAFEAIKREGSYQALVKVTHWKGPLFDLSAHLEGVFFGPGGDQLSPRLSLTGRHVLINSYPADNFGMRLTFDKNKVVLSDMKWGPISAAGNIKFDGRLDIDVGWQGLALEDMVSLFDDQRAVVTEGRIDGTCRVTGSLKKPKISGRGYSYNGFVGNWEYSFIDIGVEGIFPRLHFTDAYVAQTDGFAFTLSGIIDLSDIKNFKMQSRGWVKEALVTEDDVSREWTVKRTYFGEEGGTSELKYLFRKDEDSLDEGSGMIGIERKFRF